MAGSDEERNEITAILPMLRDWYVQAGGAAVNDESIHTRRAAI